MGGGQIDQNACHIETRHDLDRSVVVCQNVLKKKQSSNGLKQIQAARQKRNDIPPDEVEEFDAIFQSGREKLEVPVELATRYTNTHLHRHDTDACRFPRLLSSWRNLQPFPFVHCPFVFH